MSALLVVLPLLPQLAVLQDNPKLSITLPSSQIFTNTHVGWWSMRRNCFPPSGMTVSQRWERLGREGRPTWEPGGRGSLVAGVVAGNYIVYLCSVLWSRCLGDELSFYESTYGGS